MADFELQWLCRVVGPSLMDRFQLITLVGLLVSNAKSPLLFATDSPAGANLPLPALDRCWSPTDAQIERSRPLLVVFFAVLSQPVMLRRIGALANAKA